MQACAASLLPFRTLSNTPARGLDGILQATTCTAQSLFFGKLVFSTNTFGLSGIHFTETGIMKRTISQNKI
jgi:hypothetical protein